MTQKDLISQSTQTDDLFKYPLHELLGLDKQLRSIRGSLKVEVAKKVQLEKHINKEHCKSRESESILESMTMAFKETSPSKSML